MSGNTPLALSVIVCTRHRPLPLRSCLASVRKVLEAVPDSELIVVDNAKSPLDDTREIVEGFGGRYLWEGVRGLSRARNRGILEARASIVAFLDDDVTVSEDWAKILLDNFSDSEVLAVTGAVASAADSDVGAIWYRMYRPFSDGPTSFSASSNIPFFPITAGFCGIASNMAFRRAFFFRYGFFDPNLGAGCLAPGNEEVDRFYVALRAGGRIRFDPSIRVQHEFPNSRSRFFLKVGGYAAGQAAYLAKWFIRDPASRASILGFTRDRFLGFFRSGRSTKRARSVRAPRLPLLLGTLWGPVGYFLSTVRERFWPHRTVLIPSPPLPTSADEVQDKLRLLVSLYNAGLTGPEKLATLLAQRLAQQTSLTILLPTNGVATEQIRNLGIAVGIIPRWRLRATLNPFYQLGYLLALPGSVAAFRKAIRAISPDIVHIHTIRNLSALLAAKLTRKPVLLHVHEITGGLVGKLLCHLGLFLSDRILAVSNAVAQTFPSASLNRRVFVVYNGVSTERSSASGNHNASTEQEAYGWITFIGRLSEDKGPHLFLQAGELVFQAEPTTRFLLCGLTVPDRRRYEQRLQKMMELSPIPPSQLCLLKDREDIDQFMHRSKIVVSCSLIPDPFPMAILEAMAMAKPVVAPSSGGLPEMVIHEETGLLYPPGNAERLARGILQLIREPEFAKQIGLAARRRVEQEFNADKTERAVLHHYQAVCHPTDLGS